MCGIYASVSKRGPLYPTQHQKQLLCNRGPDYLGELQANIGSGDDALALLFTSAVLALRGGHVAEQPLIDQITGSVLCWNGEAWKIGQDLVKGNDGEVVLNLLASGASEVSDLDSIAHVLDVIHSISGPFAFIYFDKSHELIYFSRDCLGRRSLLFNTEDVTGAVQFSSVSDTTRSAWREVETDGIYVLDITCRPVHLLSTHLVVDCSQSFCFPVYRIPWTLNALQEAPNLFLSKLNSTLPIELHDLDANSSSIKQLERHLRESLKLRLLDIPSPPRSQSMNHTKLAILFSGGVDCTVLARLAHDLLPPGAHIDLLNVAFENPRVVQAANLRSETNKRPSQTPDSYRKLDPLNQSFVLSAGSGKRRAEPITSEQYSVYEACPDRVTGRKALQELRQVCPGRKWRFVEVNVPYAETISHRLKVVSLMYPHNTEMDLSIGYALYFAARGIGLASTDNDVEPVKYETSARVLLSGLGADELFGGYTRHATAFARSGFPGLLSELQLDVNRLGKRNLGRDDRVIANWGREARYPYLDESLVKWALDCPIWGKCGFGTREQAGQEESTDLEPGKKVLRLLARKLGMHSVAKEKKRAACPLVHEKI